MSADGLALGAVKALVRSFWELEYGVRRWWRRVRGAERYRLGGRCEGCAKWVSLTWIASLTMANGAPVFSFGLTGTPDPLGTGTTEWGTIERRFAPQSGWCDVTGPIDALWLGEHLWRRTRVGMMRLAPASRFPEEANGSSFRATSNCVRLRLVARLGDEEHGLMLAGSF